MLWALHMIECKSAIIVRKARSSWQLRRSLQTKHCHGMTSANVHISVCFLSPFVLCVLVCCACNHSRNMSQKTLQVLHLGQMATAARALSCHGIFRIRAWGWGFRDLGLFRSSGLKVQGSKHRVL